VEEQLWKFIDACECLSLSFDESSDMVNVAQLCAFIRNAIEDMSSMAELLVILSLKGHTSDVDICKAFVGFVRGQNCRCSFDVGDIATKVKSLFDLESSTLEA